MQNSYLAYSAAKSKDTDCLGWSPLWKIPWKFHHDACHYFPR